MFSSVFVVDGREVDGVVVLVILGCGGPGPYWDARMSQWLMVRHVGPTAVHRLGYLVPPCHEVCYISVIM